MYSIQSKNIMYNMYMITFPDLLMYYCLGGTAEPMSMTFGQ